MLDDSFLVLFNGHYEDVSFTLPTRRFGAAWTTELDTAIPDVAPGSDRVGWRSEVVLGHRSLKLLRRVP